MNWGANTHHMHLPHGREILRKGCAANLSSVGLAVSCNPSNRGVQVSFRDRGNWLSVCSAEVYPSFPLRLPGSNRS